MSFSYFLRMLEPIEYSIFFQATSESLADSSKKNMFCNRLSRFENSAKTIQII